jgi:hypothetical protein
MVPPALFSNVNAVIAFAVGFTFMVGYFGLPFVMSLFLQQQRGLSALQTGASLSCATAAMSLRLDAGHQSRTTQE